MHLYLALAAALSCSIAATPLRDHQVHVVHERSVGLHRYSKRDVVPRDLVVPMRIGLSQGNLDKGHDMLMEISKHDSPKYGQHYSAEEIIDLFAPERAAVEAVNAWLEDSGISSHRVSQSTNKQWIQFDASVDEVERLLSTQYHVYELEDDESYTQHMATDLYHVPLSIRKHVDYITPGVRPVQLRVADQELAKRGLSRRQLSARGVYVGGPIRSPAPAQAQALVRGSAADTDPLAICGIAVTPDCIKALYNITSTNTPAAPGNEMGIFETSGEFYSQEDMDTFYESLAPYVPAGYGPTPDLVDGAPFINNQSVVGSETDLDFQCAQPIIYPQKTVLFNVDDLYYQEYAPKITGLFNTFLDALDGSYCSTIEPNDPVYPDNHNSTYGAQYEYKGALQCGVFTPTNVISASYALQESTHGSSFFAPLPIAYQRRQCNEFMKLGLQGSTIIFSSGDGGIGPRSERCLGTNDTIFSPGFPATCPYLTTVGSTTLPSGASAGIDAEIATTQFGSGGGFSNIYDIPDYQASAVANYFEHYVPDYPFYQSTNNDSFGLNGGIYNRNGRGYPDVSAVGQNILTVISGHAELEGGTSASAPIFAAIITRINDERIAVGKKPVGFVNPVLYANPDVLHDITQGSNPTEVNCGVAGRTGFVASPGWDPVSGLGTPDYPKMLELFLSLP